MKYVYANLSGATAMLAVVWDAGFIPLAVVSFCVAIDYIVNGG